MFNPARCATQPERDQSALEFRYGSNNLKHLQGTEPSQSCPLTIDSPVFRLETKTTLGSETRSVASKKVESEVLM
jgi:hypothetical protein